MKNIVLIIDWQNCYFNKDAENRKYMGGAIDKTASIIRAARENGDQVVWIGMKFRKDTDENLFFTPLFSDAFHPKLIALREDHDPVFFKNESSAFSNEKFKSWLSEQHFDSLIFTGFSVHDCVYHTLLDSVNNGYGNKCLHIRDACGDEPCEKSPLGYSFNQLSTYHGGRTCSAARLLDGYRNNSISSIKAMRFPERTKTLCEVSKTSEILKYQNMELSFTDRTIRSYFETGDPQTLKIYENRLMQSTQINQSDLQKLKSNPNNKQELLRISCLAKHADCRPLIRRPSRHY